MNNITHNTPNWLYETAACLSEQYINREKEVIENHTKRGMTKDEIIDFFHKYKLYKETVSNEIVPIYNKYPLLEKFFKEIEFASEIHHCIALSLVMFLDEDLSASISHIKIDEVINKYMSTVMSDLTTDNTDVKLNINNLTDLMDVLSQVNIHDNLQIQLISLYHNRYEIINQLSEMLHLCAPISKKYFYIIEDEYEKSVEYVNKIDDLEKHLESSIDMKISAPFNGEITLTIFYFNSLSMNINNDKVLYHIGMYFFLLVDLKEKNKFNDAQIITDLKALADPTRLKIVGLLSKNNMYIQELSESLELTPATISHHINILLNSELISITVDAEKTRKIYYEANSKKIDSLGDAIKGLVIIDDQGGNVYGGENQLSGR